MNPPMKSGGSKTAEKFGHDAEGTIDEVLEISGDELGSERLGIGVRADNDADDSITRRGLHRAMTARARTSGAPKKAKVEAEDAAYADPLRSYLKKMGTYSLLTREGEVEIAKRIEENERLLLEC